MPKQSANKTKYHSWERSQISAPLSCNNPTFPLFVLEHIGFQPSVSSPLVPADLTCISQIWQNLDFQNCYFQGFCFYWIDYRVKSGPPVFWYGLYPSLERADTNSVNMHITSLRYPMGKYRIWASYQSKRIEAHIVFITYRISSTFWVKSWEDVWKGSQLA